MLEYFSKNWFDFVYVMTVKEIKARYKRVFLGFLWIFLNPLLQMAVIGFVFQFFIPIRIENYFYFLFSGLLPWNFFAYTITKCTTHIYNERGLVQKAKFPVEALLLSIVFSNLFHFLVSILLFGLISIYVGFLNIVGILTILFAIFWIVVFVVGLSLLLATLFVKFRDVKFIVNAVVPLWFYATPIIYTREILPEEISNIILLNPMTGIIELFQSAFSTAITVDLNTILYSAAFSILVFISGVVIFKQQSAYFDDWL